MRSQTFQVFLYFLSNRPLRHNDQSLTIHALPVSLFFCRGRITGGIVSDRIGRYKIIWISVLGPLPLTLMLPYADLFWTVALTVAINLIMASAFASILIYAMELAPNRIGLVGGLFMA